MILSQSFQPRRGYSHRVQLVLDIRLLATLHLSRVIQLPRFRACLYAAGLSLPDLGAGLKAYAPSAGKPARLGGHP